MKQVIKRAAEQSPRALTLRRLPHLIFTELFTLCQLNLLFLVSCIPIITIGPAWAALTQVMQRTLRSRCSHPVREYFEAFRQNFKVSFVVSLLSGAVCAAAILSCFLYHSLSASSTFFLLLFFLAAIFAIEALLITSYIFPILVTIDLPLTAVLRNALLLTLACPHHIIPAVCCAGILCFITIATLPFSIPFAVLLLFSLSNIIITYAAWTDIQKYIALDQTES